MARTLVIDASVWVSAFDPSDAHHEASVAFLRAVEPGTVRLATPMFALVETGCAIVRRTGSVSAASDATRALMRHPLLSIEEMSAGLLATALKEGVRRRLRGADAVYVATAQLTGGQLVAWDTELVARGGAIPPTAWRSSDAERT